MEDKSFLPQKVGNNGLDTKILLLTLAQGQGSLRFCFSDTVVSEKSPLPRFACFIKNNKQNEWGYLNQPTHLFADRSKLPGLFCYIFRRAGAAWGAFKYDKPVIPLNTFQPLIQVCYIYSISIKASRPENYTYAIS